MDQIRTLARQIMLTRYKSAYVVAVKAFWEWKGNAHFFETRCILCWTWSLDNAILLDRRKYTDLLPHWISDLEVAGLIPGHSAVIQGP